MYILVPVKTMSQDCRKGAGSLRKKLTGKISGSCDCKHTKESVHLSLEELAAQVQGTANIGRKIPSRFLRQQFPLCFVCKSHQICRQHTESNNSATCGGLCLYYSAWLASAAAEESAASLCSVARSVSVQDRDRCPRKGGEALGLG